MAAPRRRTDTAPGGGGVAGTVPMRARKARAIGGVAARCID